MQALAFPHAAGSAALPPGTGLAAQSVAGSPDEGTSAASPPEQAWGGRLERIAARVPPQLAPLLAWLVCLAPRALACWQLGLIGDYHVFADAGAKTEAHWYPLYRLTAELLWSASAGSVGLFAGYQVALHATIGPLVYGSSRRLGLSPAAAWLAVLGVAVLPYYVSMAPRQPQAGLVIAFVALTFWTFLAWRDSGYGWPGGVGFAALAGVSIFLRPNLLLTAAAFYAVALMETARARGGERAAPLRILASGCLVGVALAGIAAHSKATRDHWSPFQPIAGYNLFLGHNERVGEYLRRWDVLSVEDVVRDHGFPPSVEGIEDPYERDQALGALAIDFARSHPGETAVNTLLKAWRYWDFRLEDAERNPLLWNLAYSGPYVFCVMFAVLGGVSLVRRGRGRSLLLVLVLLGSYWLPHLVLFPTIRMRMTTEFALIVLAAEGLAAAIGRLETRVSDRRGTTRRAPAPASATRRSPAP